MGCLPACFGQLRRNATMKRVQDQCESPSYEPVKFSPDKIESNKEEEEEEIVYPTKLITESESNEEKTVMDVVKRSSNEVGSDELVEEKENGKAEKEREKGKEDEDFLINDKEVESKENSLQSSPVQEVESKENSLQSSPVQEESVGSLFSLSIDSRKHIWGAEMGDKEVSSALKMKSTSLKSDDGDKENSKDPLMEQSFDKSKPLSDGQCKRRDGEMAVETSLSSWLVESEKSPQKLSAGGSPESENNYGDRVVLGVIDSPVVIKELNGFSSAGSTPCCGSDGQPGVGTVGQYWRRTSARALARLAHKSQPECEVLT